MNPLGPEVEKKIGEVIDLANPSTLSRGCLENLEVDSTLCEEVARGNVTRPTSANSRNV